MSPDPGYNADADLYADGRIDFADFAVLAKYWLSDGQRSDDYYYYHFDGLGSVIALSDKDGDVVEVYNYDVFGSVDSVSSVANPYYFTARRFDDETGLYYYRARIYSAERGRFLQVDPVGYEDSMNLYQYVFNNPVIYVDSLGLCSEGKDFIQVIGDNEGKLMILDSGPEYMGFTGVAFTFVGGLAVTSGLSATVVSGGLVTVGTGGVLMVGAGVWQAITNEPVGNPAMIDPLKDFDPRDYININPSSPFEPGFPSLFPYPY